MSDTYTDTVARIRSFLDLEPGWSGWSGAPRINRDVVEVGVVLLGHLERDGVPAPATFPMESGGLSFEWASGERVTSVEFGAPDDGLIVYELLDLPVEDQSRTEQFDTTDLATVHEFFTRHRGLRIDYTEHTGFEPDETGDRTCFYGHLRPPRRAIAAANHRARTMHDLPSLTAGDPGPASIEVSYRYARPNPETPGDEEDYVWCSVTDPDSVAITTITVDRP